MDQESNLGVTEARFVLTLLTCLLVAIGYVVLLRLGGAKEPTVEAGPDVSPPTAAAPHHPNEMELQPRVLTIVTPDAGPVARHPTDSERR